MSGSKLIALTVLVTTLAAGLYVGTAEKTYEARATLLVTPVPRDNATLATLGEITASSDPTRDVTTAAGLITTIDVGRAAKEKLRTDRSPRPPEGRQGGADRAEQPGRRDREGLERRLGPEPRQHRRRFGCRGAHAEVPRAGRQAHRGARAAVGPIQEAPGQAADPLKVELAGLRTLRAGDNPTLRVDTRADKPTSPSWPKRNLSLFAGIVAGLVLGVGGAFAAQTSTRACAARSSCAPCTACRSLAFRGEPRPQQDVVAPHQLSPAGSRPTGRCARRSARRVAARRAAHVR